MPNLSPGSRRRHPGAALAALLCGLALVAALPFTSFAGLLDDGRQGAVLDAARKSADELRLERARLAERARRLAAVRQAAKAEDPGTQPALHGTNPHGQGSVATIDLNPTSDRPTGGDPSGSDSGEEVVVGRARGEQRPDGSYHGHITILGLFGNEIIGVDTEEGQTASGPLNSVQSALLDPLCSGSSNMVCLEAFTADSETGDKGSKNRFGILGAKVGGDSGVQVGAAESEGNISEEGGCQTSSGSSRVLILRAGGADVAAVGESRTESKSCAGQAPQQTNESKTIELFGSGVPLPAAGCADGTPDSQLDLAPLLRIVCNGDDVNGQAGSPSGTRDALSVTALETVLFTALGSAESRAVAPGSGNCNDGKDNDGDGKADTADPDCHTDGNPNNPETFDPGRNEGGAGKPQCSDTTDNDGDGKADAADPGCHSDGNPDNPQSYDPNDPSERDGSGKPQCSDTTDNDGDGKADSADPGCHSDGNPNNPDTYDPNDDDESDGGGRGREQCSNGTDDDGDGLVDAADPGCHSDGDAGNPDSYEPNDDSEANDDVAGEIAGGDDAGAVRSGDLPFTGAQTLIWLIGGLLMLAGGLALRRRVAS